MGGRGGSPNSGQPAPAPAAPAGDPAFDAIKRAIASEPNRQLTTLERARMELAALGLDREQQDTELLRLFRAREILLIPISNQKVMTSSERAAGMSVGNQMKTAVMLP